MTTILAKNMWDIRKVFVLTSIALSSETKAAPFQNQQFPPPPIAVQGWSTPTWNDQTQDHTVSAGTGSVFSEGAKEECVSIHELEGSAGM